MDHDYTLHVGCRSLWSDLQSRGFPAPIALHVRAWLRRPPEVVPPPTHLAAVPGQQGWHRRLVTHAPSLIASTYRNRSFIMVILKLFHLNFGPRITWHCVVERKMVQFPKFHGKLGAEITTRTWKNVFMCAVFCSSRLSGVFSLRLSLIFPFLVHSPKVSYLEEKSGYLDSQSVWI